MAGWLDGWMDGWRKSMTKHESKEEDARDRNTWRNLVVGEGKPVNIGKFRHGWLNK